MLLLFSCMIIAGIKAEDPLYGLKSSLLCLQVKISSPFKDFHWMVNDTAIVSGNDTNPVYEEKVDYNPRTRSLCIKKLTEWDSGVYKVSVVYPNFKTWNEKYRVIVQAPVPEPVIRVSLMGSNLSAGFCNMSVNCSVLGDWLLASCDENSCRTSQRSFSKVNITILAQNRYVICRGHNHVSSRNASKSIAETCNGFLDTEHQETPQPANIILLVAVAVGVFVFFAVVAVLVCLTKQRYSAKYDPSQRQPQSRGLSSSSSQPEAPYENMDVTQPSQTTGPTSSQVGSGSNQSQPVDTVYSVLQLPHLNNSHGKHDTNGHETAQASTSESGEAEHHKQVDTVYSVLQKPKK
ncbi:uncharacterized protein LOC117807137 isoform X2 [Xyrichtys novacula]|uniref:Uncharacterized protein LOC117807137 isoform X2 n=1 Tax=Xyrichtys novacula TaxID=13765 RepID=A0AAV1HJR5_XYRNO|nr:uncharacterized protein LOC117807137 isoform X2 [Xyrichtys novacula]